MIHTTSRQIAYRIWANETLDRLCIQRSPKAVSRVAEAFSYSDAISILLPDSLELELPSYLHRIMDDLALQSLPLKTLAQAYTN